MRKISDLEVANPYSGKDLGDNCALFAYSQDTALYSYIYRAWSGMVRERKSESGEAV